MKAIYAGSFMPPTMGHLDIIRRAAALFDQVIVAVLSQEDKRYELSPEQRAGMVRKITAAYTNVKVIASTGMLIDCAREAGADVILRGIRDAADLPFELQLASGNRRVGGLETLYLATSPEYSQLSSTIVRGFAVYGAPLEGMVPQEIIDEVYTVYARGAHSQREGASI